MQSSLKSYKRNQRGFTLVEMLIVLGVIQVMTSISLLVVQPLIEQYRIQFFLKQLQTDLFYMQQVAMTQTDRATFTFDSTTSTYYAVQRNEILFEKSYDSSIIISSVSGPNRVRYNSRGNISQGKTFFVRSGDTSYRLVFQIGRGRFYVEKL
ncbi:competence type IV pilus minor pilin ComGD [Bacillus sp. CGMCC 1.16541]|uniref:competence type IV pilus minor pilin ComGD n=1 Tax=Bacillus sp. CGMCC 1.16541 TaxID=2185143 RepID=UPI0013A5673C|nr:competence type IV pilus minor pilin ComGD [Bacillus sp. CGMCC 1.16541]